MLYVRKRRGHALHSCVPTRVETQVDAKEALQDKSKQQHISHQNNSSCKCHHGEGCSQPSCLKCIESVRVESICLGVVKHGITVWPSAAITTDRSLIIAVQTHTMEAYVAYLPERLSKKLLHPRLSVKTMNQTFGSNSKHKGHVYVLPVWNKRLFWLAGNCTAVVMSHSPWVPVWPRISWFLQIFRPVTLWQEAW